MLKKQNKINIFVTMSVHLIQWFSHRSHIKNFSGNLKYKIQELASTCENGIFELFLC